MVQKTTSQWWGLEGGGRGEGGGVENMLKIELLMMLFTQRAIMNDLGCDLKAKVTVYNHLSNIIHTFLQLLIFGSFNVIKGRYDKH